MAAILVMAAIGVWAASTGAVSYVITNGVSMNPVYYQGDLVFVIKRDSYQVGQIAAYHGPGGVKVLHRIIDGDAETGFVFKGDNNESIDVDKPRADELIGEAALHVPQGGKWLGPLISPTSLGVLGFLFVGGSAAKIRSRRDIPRGRQKKRVKRMSGQGGSWAVALTVAKAIGRLHPAIRAVAIAAAVCGVLGLALGVLGWMKPTTESVKAGADSGESMTFSYSADVPRSAAYDGTTVYSPDPVFRSLTDLVDLRLTYQGTPGQIDVAAKLSGANGWHATVQLAQPREFTANRFTGRVQLDLDSFDSRAKAAAEIIGAEITPVALTINARVEHDDGSTFEPSLALDLNSVQLGLIGGEASLVVDRSSSNSGVITRTRMIGGFGYELFSAALARRLAVYLLLATVVGAVIIAMIALRHVPLKTRAQIQRRYPHLLVPVEPMASPPGKPVVIVDSFPALVKLAEKYGQMILTWTRPDGADDFVVRDDGVTYRYRIVPANVTPEPQPEPRPASHRRPRKASGVAKVAAPPAEAPAAPPAEAPAPAPTTAPAPTITVTEKKAEETPAPEPQAVPEPEPAPAPEPAPIAEEEPKPAEIPQPSGEPHPTAEEQSATEVTAQEPPKPPAKRARRPRKKAAPTADKPEPTDDKTETADKPPLQRPIRLKPEAERKAMETLGELNKSVGGASAPEPEAPHEPIYDFLPKHPDQAPKHPDQAPKHPDQAPKQPDQADGATGR
ncbi:signal peptidase I [Actinoplanes missouriensis]|uniref:signal peptidase I n=1 Tax=Actinoplanes missouriensis TaxID=1866 RepID=UPI0033D866CE